MTCEAPNYLILFGLIQRPEDCSEYRQKEVGQKENMPKVESEEQMANSLTEDTVE